MLNQDPVLLYSPDGKTRRIPLVDAPGWIKAGWSTSPIPLKPVTTKPKAKDAPETADASKKPDQI
ncbi:hypothetical protein [Iningainema tapete]|uniref:Uncharacterized protein n=1 Tax=Iningainema tapete BLCC-T55 TaxID=2748662 RepID=A0A8J6XD99_9CYAN|nr:hypothetical protein [Iningainema tapete]MBD2771188.1 hypothetical protein [Iningainema tapete BLCC-T55]